MNNPNWMWGDGFEDESGHGFGPPPGDEGNGERGGDATPEPDRDGPDADKAEPLNWSETEESIVRLLSLLGWMQARSRTQDAVRALLMPAPHEYAESWLMILRDLAVECGPEAATIFDRLVAFADPQERLAIEELALKLGDRAVLRGFAKSLKAKASGSVPRPSRRRDVSQASPPPLTPDAARIMESFNLTSSGEFSGTLLSSLRARLSPAAFEKMLWAIAKAGRCYPTLKPKYCNTPLQEFVREVRRILRHRFGTDELSADDVAGLLDHELIRDAERSMRARCRDPR